MQRYKVHLTESCEPHLPLLITHFAADKITRRHREREAYVYVRQSTLKQVQQNHESRHNQYALVQRAIELGWLPERIQLIDCDLGQSGQDSQRPGFQSLVAAVSLGKVGLILAYEASRLARTNTDWYTLLDLATVVGVLIRHAWQTMPAISHGGPMELHGKEPHTSPG